MEVRFDTFLLFQSTGAILSRYDPAHGAFRDLEPKAMLNFQQTPTFGPDFKS
jgi:hypothetical protein